MTAGPHAGLDELETGAPDVVAADRGIGAGEFRGEGLMYRPGVPIAVRP